ncbi:hypothetical protein IFM89_003867 [Coptis chinensis]|uniref:Uncharacterized protein n=1 Tax=Coptis chinensis TaxID=261450 RepID=A0A835I1G0_9MAGN|nr:hypothetical protein IFM89_003867 [Coptis chinensis]
MELSYKAAAAEQVGAAKHVGAAELEGAIAKVADTALTGTEPYRDAALVIRATSTLEEYGVKATVAAAPLISPAAGIPTFLVHKDLTPNIVPNFRREETVGLQVLNLPVGEIFASTPTHGPSSNIVSNFTHEEAVGDQALYNRVRKKKGGRHPNQRARNEFVDFINNNSLRDTTTLGLRYYWCNRRIENKRILAKLDRALINNSWLSENQNWRCKILSRKFSDHSPVIGWCTKNLRPLNVPFRFKTYS